MYPREARWNELSMGQKLQFWGVIVAAVVTVVLVVLGIRKASGWFEWVAVGMLVVSVATWLWVAREVMKAMQREGDRP